MPTPFRPNANRLLFSIRAAISGKLVQKEKAPATTPNRTVIEKESNPLKRAAMRFAQMENRPSAEGADPSKIDWLQANTEHGDSIYASVGVEDEDGTVQIVASVFYEDELMEEEFQLDQWHPCPDPLEWLGCSSSWLPRIKQRAEELLGGDTETDGEVLRPDKPDPYGQIRE